MLNMRIIKTLLTGTAIALGLATSAFAAGGGVAWDKAPNRINDMGSLQNGAKLFVNYCLNCHSAAFMRYNRLEDIGLTQDQIKNSLLVTDSKIGDTMVASLHPKQAKEFFGKNPPDMTVIARSRAGANGTGADYLYTYMRTFYRDDNSPTGWNNLAFPNVGMPHVLWELQGERRAVMDPATHAFKGWEQVTPGTMSAAEYDHAVGDLVNYLQWMAEPAQTTRQILGVWVLVFLAGLSFLTWRLNKAYWKDIK